MGTSRTESRMVGREAEFAVLSDALAAGRAGRPSAVLVRGEAGIGKTRLITELRAHAESSASAAAPLVIASGQCVDLGPIGAPFTPIRRLLHELRQGVGDAAFREAARSPAVLATLSALVPDLGDGELPVGQGDYLTEAIERVIEALSADHHLLLIIEDLHWADTATLALLRTLATTLRGNRITMIMTYRGEDLDRGHPLRAVLTELDRSRFVTSLEVQRLSPEQIATQVELLTGAAPQAEELARLAERSDGIPFLVEELVDLHGSALPDTLRDLVLARFERLEEPVKDVVRYLAVGGMRVEDDVLASVWDGELRDLDEGLRAALAASVLVRDGAAYLFRHALIQEAVAEDLLPRQRADLHGRYASELQRRADTGARGLAAEIAVHWLAARDLPRAFDATYTAFEEAQASRAYLSIAELGDRLIELWPQVPDADERVGSTPAQVGLAVTRALGEQGGQGNRHLRAAQQALSLVGPEDPPRVKSEILNAIGIAQRNSGGLDRERLRALWDEACGLVEGSEDPADQVVYATALASMVQALVADDDEAIDLLDKATALAETTGDADLLATILIKRAHYLGGRDTRAAIADLERARSVAIMPSRRAHAAVNLTDAFAAIGEYRESIETGERAIAETIDAGLERGWGALIMANLAESLLLTGDAAAAEPHIRRCLTLLRNEPLFFSFDLRLLAIGTIWDERRDEHNAYRTAESSLFDALQNDEDERIGWAVADIELALAERELERDPARRATLSRKALESAGVLTEPVIKEVAGLNSRLLLPVARALTAAASDAVADDTSELRRVLDELTARLDGGAGDSNARLVAAELAGHDVGAWRAAIEAGAGRVAVWRILYARYRLAESLLASGERDGAAAELARIVAEAPGLGVTRVATWARALAASNGIPLPGASAGSGAQTTRPKAGSLTARELEVLELVAAGLTNAEIGAKLFISPKTASVHVSAILAKIGAANRAEAASLYASLVPNAAS